MLKRLLRRNVAQARSADKRAATSLLEDALQLQRTGRHADAEKLCRSVLDDQPDQSDALSLLAAALCAQGRTSEGVACLRRIAKLDPATPGVHASLADVLASTGAAEEAIEHYRRALALQPAQPRCAERLAELLRAKASYDEAEACCRAALGEGCDTAGLRHALAAALFEQGRVDEAIEEVRAALARNPDMAAAHSDLIRMLNYTDALDAAAVHREHVAWARRHAEPLAPSAPSHTNVPDPTRRLRVGFVSPHFRKHAMTFFFESTVEFLDRRRVETILYADVAHPDEYSDRLKRYGAAWRSTTALSDARFAQVVRDDAVDILVDLSGHTPGNRLLAFARRPAPVQITWNGYPNTTGMGSMDYRLTDAFCDPPGTTAHLHAEKLEYLQPVFMTWRAPADAPGITPLPAQMSGHVTFGSFNSCFKITATVAALWARVLAAVPGSHLMILTVAPGAAERRLRDLFAACGVGAGRLEILPRLPHSEFLAAHARADLALDTFPYHGTTTTCYSLWMGVPVVSLAGATPASRVGVSLLTNSGLPQFVARTADEYVSAAARIVQDLPELAALRAGLRQRLLRSPLADGPAGARALQSALRRMWSSWCARQPRAVAKKFWPAANPRNAVVASEFGPVAVSRGDTMIGASIAKYGWWEKDEIELLRWFLVTCYGRETAVEILDIGAYTGVCTVAFARFPFPVVTVHAFEPQREIYDMLIETIALNELGNVCCHHKAVSSDAALLRFPAVDYGVPANFGSVEIEPVAVPDFDGRRQPGRSEEVEAIRIDELALRKVRLMKVDAEGMEQKVLAGAADTITRCRPLIFLEYEKTDFGAIKEFLRRAKYRAYYAQRPNILCLPSEFTHIRIDGAVAVEL